MKNVFLVRTPFHYLGIFEALHYYKCKPEESVILVQAGRKKRMDIYRELCSDLNWGEIVQIMPPTKKDNAKNSFSILKNYLLIHSYNNLADQFTDVENFFTPLLHRKEVSHLCNKLKPKNVVLTDEGISMPQIMEMLRNKKEENRNSNILRYFEKQSLNYDRSIVQPNKVLSAFNLDDYEGFDIDVHQFDSLRKYYRSVPGEYDKSKSIILGSPFKRVSSSPDEYMGIIDKMLSRLSDTKSIVFYAPHPKEDSLHVKNIAQTFKMRVFNNNGIPIEYTLLKQKIIPTKIASFGSSALETLRLIFPDEIREIFVFLGKNQTFRSQSMDKVNEYAQNINDKRIVYI